MIIVPVAGDIIKTIDGLPSKVLSYSNYNDEGPLLITDGLEPNVFFRDVLEINDRKVQLIKNADGYKVFESKGYVEQKYHLPQPGEFISAKVTDVTEDFEVKRLRLHVPNELARGLILDVQRKDDSIVEEITLDQILDIDQYVFNRSAFLKYYDDYREKGSA